MEAVARGAKDERTGRLRKAEPHHWMGL
jgi:hypothetical protein